MKIRMRTETETECEVDLELLAKLFCEMTDDQQSKFFVEVAKIATAWGDPTSQWYFIGSHLRTCPCSTEGARDIVRHMMRGLETGKH